MHPVAASRSQAFGAPGGRIHVPARFALGRVLAGALLCTLLLTGCWGQAQRPDVLGPVVDSIVVQPFEKALAIKLNSADLALFQELLVAEFRTRPTVRVFPRPPTTLPNTAVITGLLTHFEDREQSGEGLFLRTLNLSVTLLVRLGADKDPAITVQRDYTYQRVYPAGMAVTTFEFDLHNAVQELCASLGESLMPGPPQKLVLERAVDQGTGQDFSHPYLAKGINEAQAGRYDNAITEFSLALYDPGGPTGERRYRVSDRTLERLAQRDVGPEPLAKLKPLTKLNPMTLVPFRAEVRKVLGEESPLEPQVLQMADAQRDKVELNLARAHENMARVYHVLKRLDLEAYHLSRAYAWDPHRALANAWITLQLARNLVPQDMDGRAFLELYLRVPGPDAAVVQGGAFDRTVLPPPAIAEVAPVKAPAAASKASRQDAASAPAIVPTALPPTAVPSPAAGALQPVPLQPVAVPPASSSERRP